MSLAELYQGKLKKCSQCDEVGMHHLWDGNSSRIEAHDQTWEVQQARRRATRAAYGLPSVGRFLGMWWGVWVLGIAVSIILANVHHPALGVAGTLGWSMVMMFAWLWYDWCHVCLKRGRGDHARCNAIMWEV